MKRGRHSRPLAGAPPSRARLLLIALPLLVLSLGNFWLRERERERVRQALVSRQLEASQSPTPENGIIDPQTMALMEAEQRGEVTLALDRDGHLVAIPVTRDGGAPSDGAR